MKTFATVKRRTPIPTRPLASLPVDRARFARNGQEAQVRHLLRGLPSQTEPTRSDAPPLQGLISRLPNGRNGAILQRAIIDHRQLTWKDFKGKVPKSPSTDAWTKAFIETFGRWRASTKATNTQKPCTLGKKKSTEYKAKAFIPPAVFDRVRARMNQDKSWAILRLRDVSAFCKSKIRDCQRHFGDAFKKIETQCRKSVADCKAGFKKGSSSWSLPIGSKTAVANSSADCAGAFLKQCREFSRVQVAYSLQVLKIKKIFATAKTKKDCKGAQFTEDCKTFLDQLSAKLLAHEQGHFDLAKVMADKTKAALVAKAATLFAEAAQCGKTPAKKAAFEAFKKLKAGEALNQIYNDGNDGKNQADLDYDNDTDHGLKDKEEAAWKKKIAAGLTAYPVPKAP